MGERITAIRGHKSQYPNPIRFEPGEALTLGRRDSEYPGWVWVTTASGNQGWAPEQWIRRQSSTRGIAAQAYSAKELDTVEGESLTLLEELNDWLRVENESGECGWIPKKTTTAA